MSRQTWTAQEILLTSPTNQYALYLCPECRRLEMFHAEDGRWIRRTYYDDTPVLHKALRG